MYLSIYTDLIGIGDKKTIGLNYFSREVSIINDSIEKVKNNPLRYCTNSSTLFTHQTPEGEFERFVAWFDKQSSDLSSLNILWALTTQCNLACIYCYEDGSFKYESYSRPDNMVENIIAAFENYQRYFNTKDFCISFYGGEPTIRAKQIVQAIKLFGEASLNVTYGLFTNGYKIPEDLFGAIIANDFAFVQITIDGEREYHDKLRPTIRGGGSFSQIFSNTVRLLKHNVNVRLTMNFNSTNVGSIMSFLEHNQFMKDYPSLEVCFAPIFITKSKESTLGKRRSWKEIASDWFNLTIYAYELGYNTNLFRLFDRGLCSYYSQNSFVLHPSGDIYKCIGASGKKGFCISNISTLLEDPVSFAEKVKGKMVKPFIKDKKCHFCKYLPICLGGCRFHAIEEKFNIQKTYCHKDLIRNCECRLIKYAVTN